MQIMEGPEFQDVEVRDMLKIRAIRLDKNEKTVKDVIEGFVNSIYPSESKWGVLIEDDGFSYGFLRLDDTRILPKYLNREVLSARLQADKWEKYYCLKIYLKPLVKRETIFLEVSQSALLEDKMVNLLRDLTFSAHNNEYDVQILLKFGISTDTIRELHYKNVFIDGVAKELPENGNYYIFKCERRL